MPFYFHCLIPNKFSFGRVDHNNEVRACCDAKAPAPCVGVSGSQAGSIFQWFCSHHLISTWFRKKPNQNLNFANLNEFRFFRSHPMSCFNILRLHEYISLFTLALQKAALTTEITFQFQVEVFLF